jgi:hypothetical protein
MGSGVVRSGLGLVQLLGGPPPLPLPSRGSTDEEVGPRRPAVIPKFRAHLTYANVMATVAVFVALGGSSYAAIKVTGKNVKDNSLTTKDIKNKSLLMKDFKSGQLPAGAVGPQGQPGAKGPPGEDGFDGFDGANGADGKDGSALAYAMVNPSTAGGPTLVAGRTFGFSDVSRAATGIYCLTLDIDIADLEAGLAPVVSPELFYSPGTATSGHNFFAATYADAPNCSAGDIQVETRKQTIGGDTVPAAALSDEVSFTVAVP